MNIPAPLPMLQGSGPFLILVMQGIAFWPVWRWYGERITDGSDEPWGIVALVTAIVFLVWRGKPGRGQMLTLGCAAVLVTLYALSFPFLPALVRAILAVLTLSCTLSAFTATDCIVAILPWLSGSLAHSEICRADHHADRPRRHCRRHLPALAG